MDLNKILANAEAYKYAVGSFSPRYRKLIKPVLKAAIATRSPVIVQISQKELEYYADTPAEFAEEYFRQLRDLNVEVPTTLHLDHTKDIHIVEQAMDAGFESVMIDASDKEFDDNIKISKFVADMAHERNVCVEAELGRIFAADRAETDSDEEVYTLPNEVEEFVRRTEVDALAVSIGTAHGIYTARKPLIRFDILKKIRAVTDVYLVLHGGSGVPPDMVIGSYQIEGGGISKVNIATDIEQSFLNAIGAVKGNNIWCDKLSAELLERGRVAVEYLVAEKITNYLHSAEKVDLYTAF